MLTKPNAIVYLRRNDLIVGGRHLSPGKLKFTSDIIDNLEIKNPDVFIGTTQEFFTNHDLKGKKVLVVLDQKLVFTKSVEITDDNKDQIDIIIENFVSAMPFLPGQRACTQFRQDNQLVIFATNADLYNSIEESLKLAGAKKIVGVTPSVAYDIDFTARSSVIIQQFIDDKKVRHTVDFSTVTPL